MAFKWQLRSDTSANWTTANPILAAGEMVIESDTKRLKIGNGTTAYASLGYKDSQGVSGSLVYMSYGDGSDGNVVISSGTTTLTKDMYYNNLTLNGTGSINTNNFKIFIAGVLDITAAPAGAIQNNGLAGNAASASTPGAALSALTANTLGVAGLGGVGAASSTAVGVTGTAGVSPTVGNGGTSGQGGAGGTNGTNLGGAAKAGVAATLPFPIRRWETEFLKGITLIGGGVSGSSGASGGGDGTNSSGAGGGGGNGGGVIAIFARTILRGPNTALGAIQSNGGNGGAGGTPTTGICGGGGGAGGAGGGWIFIAFEKLAGSKSTQSIQANGGSGAVGGAGIGSGAIGGQGGNGGVPGRVTLFQSTLGICNEFTAIAPIQTGGLGVNLLGGNGATGGILQVDL